MPHAQQLSADRPAYYIYVGICLRFEDLCKVSVRFFIGLSSRLFGMGNAK